MLGVSARMQAIFRSPREAKHAAHEYLSGCAMPTPALAHNHRDGPANKPRAPAADMNDQQRRESRRNGGMSWE